MKTWIGLFTGASFLGFSALVLTPEADAAFSGTTNLGVCPASQASLGDTPTEVVNFVRGPCDVRVVDLVLPDYDHNMTINLHTERTVNVSGGLTTHRAFVNVSNNNEVACLSTTYVDNGTGLIGGISSPDCESVAGDHTLMKSFIGNPQAGKTLLHLLTGQSGVTHKFTSVYYITNGG